MFYEGRKHLDPFSHIYFEHNADNAHHNRAYMVKLCSNSKVIGHLSHSIAEAIYECVIENMVE